MLKSHALRVGDWARVHKAGIWQIYRVLNIRTRDPASGAEIRQPMIFAKRFLSDAFRKSFSQTCCHSQLASLLSKTDQRRLDEFIDQHGKLFAEFNALPAERIDHIYNARIAVPRGKSSEQIERWLSTQRTFKEIEIQEYLADSGLVDGFPCWTVQFVCVDHTCDDDGWLQYSFSRVLKS